MAYVPAITIPSQIFDTPAASILLPITLGAAVGYSTRPKETQATYLALKQPPLRPPPYVFGPAWTTLYGLMGYAAYRAWTVGMSSFDPVTVESTRRGATVYTVQLALNLIWMPLFFGAKRPVEASVDIIALSGTVAYLAYTWSKVDKVATWCLAPYLGWLGFATYLCIGTGYLNKWDLASKEKSKDAKQADTKFVDEDPNDS
ncbi:putative translocator protein [Phaeomoniella chlamydospora]|uniref:Putative translocator protein n=1 Tax=Phaeomoniella chlamydospora TaxID=158046 RepID=A0A0G2GAB5_PHACM|nr:putative translocator protein [Phaeomoniella chlamydospora]